VIVTKESPWTVEETGARLEAVIAAKGLELFAVIDHSGAARAHGLQLRETKVVVFGSPVAGTPVMDAAPLAALDLPLKVLVWDDGGQTKLSYLAPAELAARYGLDDTLAQGLKGIELVVAATLDDSR
jgi:uncharacterized protein (DUF302 family)